MAADPSLWIRTPRPAIWHAVYMSRLIYQLWVVRQNIFRRHLSSNSIVAAANADVLYAAATEGTQRPRLVP